MTPKMASFSGALEYGRLYMYIKMIFPCGCYLDVNTKLGCTRLLISLDLSQFATDTCSERFVTKLTKNGQPIEIDRFDNNVAFFTVSVGSYAVSVDNRATR